MDHDTAVRSDAAARYYLKELAETESEAFEDHLAECSACTEDLRSLTIFAANAKAILQEKTAAPARAVERRPGWLDRLRLRWTTPALALSAVANILLFVGLGYEMTTLARFTAPRTLTAVAAARAEKGVTATAVHQGETSVLVLFDLPERPAQKYEFQLSTGGSVVRDGFVRAPEQPEDTLYLDVPTLGLKPGQYRLRVFNADRKSDDLGSIIFQIK
jgi:hypothetical protein